MGAADLLAYECLASKGACRVRVSRMTAGGALDPGLDSLYVTDAIIRLTTTPQVTTGETFQQRNGCGALCVDLKDPDEVNRATAAGTLCTLDPELLHLLTGADLIVSGGTTIGMRDRVGAAGEPVLFELWSQAIALNQQATDDNGEAMWFHFVFPYSTWTPGEITNEAGVLTMPITGDLRPNANIGLGAAADWPAEMTSYRNFYLDDAIPDSVCGLQPLVVLGSV